MGDEARGKGIHVLLAPSLGPLGRVPHGGRNWEGFGSDPYLQGVGGSLTVHVSLHFTSGYSKERVLTTLNLIGHSRRWCPSYSQTLHCQ